MKQGESVFILRRIPEVNADGRRMNRYTQVQEPAEYVKKVGTGAMVKLKNGDIIYRKKKDIIGECKHE